MILAKIVQNNNEIVSVNISGHANSGEFGQDLVCAAVTAIVNGGINGLDIKFRKETKLIVNENEITIKVIKSNDILQTVLHFMLIQLQTISIQYPKNFKIEGMI